MAIVNRDLDPSQKNYVLQESLGAVATGVSAVVGMVQSAGQILAWKVAGRGLSATPVYQLAIHRPVGTGATAIALGSALTMAVGYGVSGNGAYGATFAANGSLSAVQAGDLIVVNSSGSNTAVTDLIVALVIQSTQDIKTTFGED